jgi:DNA-binding transcriptional LysR family regulator
MRVVPSPRVRPDLRQLQYFVAVAEELNFTRAAERLDVVQQSLSTAIAQLEALLGIKLFERTTRSVALTTDGAAWLPYAREALHAADRAAEAAEDLAAGRVGRFRLGLAATAGVDVTPRMLRAFAERFPLVELAIEHFDFRDPSGGLRDRRSDVAIVRPPFEEDGLELVAIGTEPRFAVLPTDHPLAVDGCRNRSGLVRLLDGRRTAVRVTEGRRDLSVVRRALRGRAGGDGDGSGSGDGGPHAFLAVARLRRGARHRAVDACDRLAVG